MYLVTRADGKFWDGMGWNVKGKPFCSIGGATRSLHEEGEPATSVEIIDCESLTETEENVSTSEFPTWYPKVD